jgi:hypothetical protein
VAGAYQDADEAGLLALFAAIEKLKPMTVSRRA